MGGPLHTSGLFHMPLVQRRPPQCVTARDLALQVACVAGTGGEDDKSEECCNDQASVFSGRASLMLALPPLAVPSGHSPAVALPFSGGLGVAPRSGAPSRTRCGQWVSGAPRGLECGLPSIAPVAWPCSMGVAQGPKSVGPCKVARPTRAPKRVANIPTALEAVRSPRP